MSDVADELRELLAEERRCHAIDAQALDTIRPILERLATIGHEDWKSPGHPMNEWVSRDAVNIAARQALDAFPGGPR